MANILAIEPGSVKLAGTRHPARGEPIDALRLAHSFAFLFDNMERADALVAESEVAREMGLEKEARTIRAAIFLWVSAVRLQGSTEKGPTGEGRLARHPIYSPKES